MTVAGVVFGGVVGALFVLWVVLTVAHAYCALQDQRHRAEACIPAPPGTARQATDVTEADD